MKHLLTGLSALALLASVTPTHAAFVVAGEMQTEQNDIVDWDPFFSSLILIDQGDGTHTVTANNLLNGEPYNFRIVDDEGTPPAEWGDPEINPPGADLRLFGDADGSATITVDTNLTNAQGNPQTWLNFDGAPFQVVGDFMVAAGGAANWEPADPTFQMSSQGNGYYTFDASLSTPGVYQFKVTTGDGWGYQVGTDGFNNNAITHGFITSAADQQVTFFVDLDARAIGAVVESFPFGNFVVAGDLQTEQGDPADNDVVNSSLLMIESGGVYTVTANNLANGTAYDFAVYNDAGTPPIEAGDPRVTPYDLTLYGDASGSATISVDTNQTNLQGNPVVWVDFDSAPLQVVGDFMDEAGGAADWDPTDDLFNMSAQGDGYYTYDATISTPGIYQFKASFGEGWGDQVGTDGFSDNATSFGFETTETDEAVTLFVDLANQVLGVLSEVAELIGDYNGSGQVEQADLDLVLQNWGRDTDANGVPTLWVHDLPEGLIDQAELDGVLLNWGATATPNLSGANVPEPAALTVIVPGMMWAARRRRGDA